jgi:hypothetical protein
MKDSRLSDTLALLREARYELATINGLYACDNKAMLHAFQLDTLGILSKLDAEIERLSNLLIWV